MLVGKALVQDEVVVALKGVTIDTGIVVAVVGNELLQLHRGLRQRLDGEGHILDEARGANGACATHAGEDAAADGPVLAVDLGVFRKLGGDVESELSQTGLDLLYLLEQLLVGDTFRLCEDSRQVVIVARLHALYLTRIHVLLVLQVDGIVDRAERLVVEHLGALHHQLLGTHVEVFLARLQFLHGYHSLAAFLHREEVDHRRSLIGIVPQRLHGHLGEECQRTLAAHHRVGNDVEGVVVGNERTEVQASDVLY